MLHFLLRTKEIDLSEYSVRDASEIRFDKSVRLWASNAIFGYWGLWRQKTKDGGFNFQSYVTSLKEPMILLTPIDTAKKPIVLNAPSTGSRTR